MGRSVYPIAHWTAVLHLPCFFWPRPVGYIEGLPAFRPMASYWMDTIQPSQVAEVATSEIIPSFLASAPSERQRVLSAPLQGDGTWAEDCAQRSRRALAKGGHWPAILGAPPRLVRWVDGGSRG